MKTSVVFLSLLSLFAISISGCGVKAPPLMPLEEDNEELQKKKKEFKKMNTQKAEEE